MLCASYLLAHLCEFDEARAMAISLGINSVENGGNVPKEFWEKPWIGEIDDAAKMRNEEMKN